MKRDTTTRPAQEIELKLALPASDPAGLATRLARIPLLARRKATQLRLHNIYYDTPEQVLRRQRAALRLRRVGSEKRPRWLQTLKTGGADGSALSQRGEWEVPVPGAALKRGVLKDTPWSRLDPDGAVFRALAPCFVTTFHRTSWTVRRRNGSVVEVALDIGHIEAGERRSAICELELELLAGPPQALFDMAQLIARDIAVLPATQSKAERGFALAQGVIDMPVRAQPPILGPKLSVTQAATLQRKAVRFALQVPTVGACLLTTTQWIEGLTAVPAAGTADAGHQEPLPRWARQRVVRLHRQLKRALKQAPDAAHLHRVRILSKRLRYGIEALRPLLPKKRTAHWHEQALRLQTSLGMTRDVLQASALATQLEANRVLAEFLRGVAIGSVTSPGNSCTK